MRAARGPALVVTSVIAALSPLPGCGGDASCPNDLPAACPTPAPGWQATVEPIVGERCQVCHQPGGLSAGFPMTTYQQVYSLRSPMLNQLYACRMPPAGATPPTAAERAALLAWLVCGAPDN